MLNINTSGTAAMLLSNPFRPDPRVLKEAEGLSTSGYSMNIICWDRAREYDANENLPNGVKIIRVQNIHSSYGIGMRQLFRLPLFWLAAYTLLNKLKPDIVHCHDFDTLPIGLLWGKLHRRPVIYDAHEYYVELIKPRLSGLFGKLLNIFITNSEHLGTKLANAIITVDDTLAKQYQRYNKRVIIIGHYPPKSYAAQHNPIFSRPELTLIYSGRISTDRGSLIYIDILRQLLTLDVPAKLKLMGVFVPEKESSAFWENARDVQAHIDFLGWVPFQHIQDSYHISDIGLVLLKPEPRYIAALPVKLFEYMAAGLPVIASDFPHIRQIVESTNSGVLVNPNFDAQSIAELIASWWDAPSIPISLGENGRQAILTKYNWEVQTEWLTSLYTELINR